MSTRPHVDPWRHCNVKWRHQPHMIIMSRLSVFRIFWKPFSRFFPIKIRCLVVSKKKNQFVSPLNWAATWDFQQCRNLTAKAETSLRIRAVWSELLLVARIFHDSKATDRILFGVSKLKRRQHRLVWVLTCQNDTVLRLICHRSASRVMNNDSQDDGSLHCISFIYSL